MGPRTKLGKLNTSPAWVEYLIDSGISSDEEKKLKSFATECGLCKVALNGLRDLEVSNKKCCRVCKSVICRQCACLVHILGKLKRKMVCFKCVGEAATRTALVPPIVIQKDTPAVTVSDPIREAKEEASGGKFNGDQLKSLFNISHGAKGNKTAVLSVPFTKACSEAIKLMASLGKAFEFAGSDMNDKLLIMGKRTNEVASDLKIPQEEVTCQMMIEREIKAGTTHGGKKAAGATRTIVRLLWSLDFISVLLSKLSSDPKVALTKVIGETYEETLAPRHVWVLRRMVRSGISMAPEKKVFLTRMGVENLSESEQVGKFKLWAQSIDEVRIDLWNFIESNGLSNVP